MADDYGHATVNDAIALAVRAQVGTLVLTHHSPTRTDDELDLLAATVSAPMPVIIGRARTGPGGERMTGQCRQPNTPSVGLPDSSPESVGCTIYPTGGHRDRRTVKEPTMTSNQGQTETNDIQTTTDDVEGHRIAPFIEDYKDDAMGLRRSADDDVEGHRRGAVHRRGGRRRRGPPARRRSPTRRTTTSTGHLRVAVRRRGRTTTSTVTCGCRSPTRRTTTSKVTSAARSRHRTAARRSRRAAVLSGPDVVGQRPQHGLRLTGGDRPVSSDDPGE